VRSGDDRQVCHRLLQRLALARRAIIGIYFPPIPWPMTNCQGFGEDANCVGGAVVWGEFNKLCCVLSYCAIGVGMFWMGWCDSDLASNGEARGEC